MIRIHMNPAIGAKRLLSLNRADLERFRTDLREKVNRKTGKPLAPKTVNLVLAQLKQMLAAAVAWGLIPQNPAVALKAFKLDEQAFQFWTETERDYFLRFAKQHDPALTELVAVAVHTGLRRGELAGLTVGQLNFDRRLILVEAVYCFKTGQRYMRTKNRRIGWVPMNEVVLQTLADRRLMHRTAPVFTPEVFQHLVQRFKRLARKVGVKEIRFHDLRHTFASNLCTAGVELYRVQRMLRHETPEMTQRYAHLADWKLQEAVDSLIVAHKGGTQVDSKPRITQGNQPHTLEP
jgi:integrase